MFKNSCGLAVVVFQEATEPFATANRRVRNRGGVGRRKQHYIALTLVGTLFVKMSDVLMENMTKRPLAKQNDPRQRFPYG